MSTKHWAEGLTLQEVRGFNLHFLSTIFFFFLKANRYLSPKGYCILMTGSVSSMCSHLGNVSATLFVCIRRSMTSSLHYCSCHKAISSSPNCPISWGINQQIKHTSEMMRDLIFLKRLKFLRKLIKLKKNQLINFNLFRFWEKKKKSLDYFE